MLLRRRKTAQLPAEIQLSRTNCRVGGCRFRKLDSRVSMMEPTKDRVCNNISEPLNRACVGRVLPERNMSSYVIIIGDVFRTDDRHRQSASEDRIAEPCVQRPPPRDVGADSHSMREKSACAALKRTPDAHGGAAPALDHLPIARRSARANDHAA